MKHLYIKKDIPVNDEFIKRCAEKYIECRGKISSNPAIVCNQPVFKATGFAVDNLQQVINKYTAPKRASASGGKSRYLDIYRSDLGELLMTMFFEEELALEVNEDGSSRDTDGNFTIPIKNIWDREINDSPGRGIDGVGYRYNNGMLKPTLFLGESKVSSEAKNPPQVVHAKEDSIYKTHKLHLEDKDYLLRKLTNHCKKANTDEAAIYYLVIMAIEFDSSKDFDVVYGCCMVRDNTVVKIDDDYGKLLTDQSCFEPNAVYFYIPNFDKSIDEVVELFYDEVQKLSK